MRSLQGSDVVIMVKVVDTTDARAETDVVLVAANWSTYGDVKRLRDMHNGEHAKWRACTVASLRVDVDQADHEGIRSTRRPGYS